MRNRLEQLRKRQRDEALQAQEELLAGVARSAARQPVRGVVPSDAVEDKVAPEEIEPYERSMSPPIIDIAGLPADERDKDILDEKEDRKDLVHFFISVHSTPQISLVATTPYGGGFAICTESRSTLCS